MAELLTDRLSSKGPGAPPRGELRAIWDRVERSNEHIAGLIRLLRDWFESDFQSLHAALDASDGALHVKGQLRTPPMRAFTIVGEFLHDLRSALDHLAWQLVLSDGGIPTRDTAFPIRVHDPASCSIAGGVSPLARSLIEGAQPSQTPVGDDPRLHALAMLQHLSNVDKHRQVPLQAVRLGSITTMGDGRSFSGACRLTEIAEDSATLMFVSSDSSVDMEGSMVVAVHLERYEGDEVGIPAVTCLRELQNYVSGLVETFQEQYFEVVAGGEREAKSRQ